MSKGWWEEIPDEVVQTPPGMHPARKEVTVDHYHYVFEEENVLQVAHQDGHILNFTALEAYALFTLLYDHLEILLRQLSQEQSEQTQETGQS